MTASPPGDRRGEAHLWLLLEEALDRARRSPEATREVVREFRHVADALATVGVIDGRVALALGGELDDALAVRGLLPVSTFGGRPFPQEAAVAPLRRDRDGQREAATTWLRSELDRHVDVLAGAHETARSVAGASALRVVGSATRALRAAGALADGAERLEADFAATLDAAGLLPDEQHVVRPGTPRDDWLQYLDDPPAPVGPADAPDHVRELRQAVGVVSGRTVSISSIAFSTKVLEVRLSVRTPSGLTASDRAVWAIRVVDGDGRLHLGPPQLATSDGAAFVVVRLRPGLHAPPPSLTIQVSCGGESAPDVRVVL